MSDEIGEWGSKVHLGVCFGQGIAGYLEGCKEPVDAGSVSLKRTVECNDVS